MQNEFFICKTDDAKDLPVPCRQTSGSSGYDLYANVDSLVLKHGDIALVPTGIRIQIPMGFEAQIRPRSGLALKYGVTLLNSPGTVDSDYRGEIKVIMINHGKEDFIIKRGDRIAQMVISRFCDVQFVHVDELLDSARGEGGFGHTGFN